MSHLTESAYDWAKIPENIPKQNLLLITAKTTNPTYHMSDPEYPVRIFNPKELQEAARSLAKRPMGINHIRKGNTTGLELVPMQFRSPTLLENDGLIKGAFTIDSQWNASTMSVEALVYLPTEYIDFIRKSESLGMPVKYSVEYTWREEKRSEAGVEFIGLCFDRVDLVIGLPAGDKATGGRLVEADLGDKRGLMEAVQISLYEAIYEEATEFDKHLGEPFADFPDWSACITHAKSKGVTNPDAWCGAVKAKAEPHKKEDQVPEVPMNTMTVASDVVPTPLELPESPQPHSNVTSIGAIPDNYGGPTGMENGEVPVPDPNSPEEQLKIGIKIEMEHTKDPEEAEKIAKDHLKEFPDYYTRLVKMEEEAKEEKEEEGEKKGEESIGPVVNLGNPDQSNQSVECMDKLKESQEPEPTPQVAPESKPEPQPEPQPESTPVPEVPPVPDPRDEEIKSLKEAVVRLQGLTTNSDSEKARIAKEAEERGKQSVISKIREVIPENGFFGGNVAMSATKRVVDDVNRKLRECEGE